MDANDNGLELRAVPVGRNGTVTITVYLRGEPVEVQKVEVVKGKDRAAFAAALCQLCPGIERNQVERELLKIAADHANRPSKGAETTDPTTKTKRAADLLAETPPEVRVEAERLLTDPTLLQRILADVAALGVAGEKELVATTYLCGTSRLLTKPLALIVQGPSSSGKSYTIEKSTRLFPPEAIVVATQLTPQALFYMEPGSLRHRFVVVGERSRLENDDAAEATRALREMLSAGRLSKLVTLKIDGTMKTALVEQEGPIAYSESTTLTKLFNEDANRCILVTTDERAEQTRKIIKEIAARYSGAAPMADASAIIARHHALQRLLEPNDVKMPFADRLAELFGTDRLEARRAFPQLLAMVEASALLHQRQRAIDDGRIVAVEDDYAIARRLLAKPLARQLGGGISDGALRFYDRLRSWVDGTFTTKEAVHHERDEHSDRSVRGWLNELHEAGGVELVEPSKGPKPAIWKLLDADFKDLGGGILPTVEVLFAK